ncbi:glycosyltransferase [Flavobacteriaceae bacterium R38]|nr:glycosyltransferase [Flavobacteriaceae bacterium R38]
MRVIQVIDSLHAGGAERLAVNCANAMTKEVDKSFLCTTREEGALKETLFDNVTYLFLNKKRTLDIYAIKKFINFLKENKIDIVHAHATSYFFTFLAKLLYPRFKLIWHDHYGNSEYIDKRKVFFLKLASLKFDGIISVNTILSAWAKKKLHCTNVIYLPNFAILNENETHETSLGGVDGKRIVCLANLRAQKDHITLLKAFELLLNDYPEWTLHLVGKDFNDDYSAQVKKMIKKEGLSDRVFFYGSRKDTAHILSQSTIGLLSSKSEGLPVSLLEYGLAELAVVCTDVGQCSDVISNSEYGNLIPPKNTKALIGALIELIKNEDLRKLKAKKLALKIQQEYSLEKRIRDLVSFYETIR